MKKTRLLMADRVEPGMDGEYAEAEPVQVEVSLAEIVFTLDDGTVLSFVPAELLDALELPSERRAA